MAKGKRPYASRRRVEPRAYDFARLTVRTIHVSETGPIIAVTMSESDLVLVGVAIGEAYQMADLPLGAVVQHPIREIDDRPVLEVHVETLPGGLSVSKRSLGGALRDKILDLDTVLSRRPVSALCLDLRSRPISS